MDGYNSNSFDLLLLISTFPHTLRYMLICLYMSIICEGICSCSEQSNFISDAALRSRNARYNCSIFIFVSIFLRINSLLVLRLFARKVVTNQTEQTSTLKFT